MGRLLIPFPPFFIFILIYCVFFSISTLLGLVRSWMFFYASGFSFRSFFCMYQVTYIHRLFGKDHFTTCPLVLVDNASAATLAATNYFDNCYYCCYY
ncbi:hypothetical protein P167DRAFT_381495 [Morchella conica CCBAS932]|uniref:Uncharacterized protein n=1 Tax=Morchella conica CCBAS932 TaxID=1392247 RepID=A0A3N4L5E9_9PEZI|nr:hypothetical protein P167DRAFT_381495 [Morchella conica CCBAS932]